MKYVYILIILIFIGMIGQMNHLIAEELLFDFNHPNSPMLNWIKNKSKDLEMKVEPLSVTDIDYKLKCTFQGGDWPGFTLPTPKDWSQYKAFHFVVWSKGPVTCNIRIDDDSSTNYATRFHQSFKLETGENFCQIELKNVSTKLNLKKITSVVIFCSKPPVGLTLYYDNFVLGNVKSNQIDFIPYKERNDLQPTLKIETPHLPFAKPLAGGPLRAFMMTSIAKGRELSEMMQRMDMDVKAMHWDPSYSLNTWGMGDFYSKRGHKLDYALMQKYITSSMQGPEDFEVNYLFTPQGWERFGQGAHEAILHRVKIKGEGLVFIFPYPGIENGKWPDSLKNVNALIDSSSDYPKPSGYVSYPSNGRIKGEKWRIVKDHPITRGLPLDALPFERMEIMKYQVAPDAEVLIETESGAPVLAVRTIGQGRVATFGYRSSGLTPTLRRELGDQPLRTYRYSEVLFSLLCRAGLWVAKRDLVVEGKNIEILDKKEPLIKAMQIQNDKGKVTDWSLIFTPPIASPIKTINVRAPEYINHSQPLVISIIEDESFKKLQQEFPQASLVVTLGEIGKNGWRSLEKIETKLENANLNPSLLTSKIRQILGVVEIQLINKKKLVAQGKVEVVITPKNKKPWEEYEILMWSVEGLVFLREYEDQLMRTFGSTGIMETRWHSAGLRLRWARAGLRLMVHDLARSQLQLRSFESNLSEYNKTKNKKLLIRQPSYADSRFLEKEEMRIKEKVKELKPFFPTNYILCDEPSLTYFRNEFDYDFHPENIERFRSYLEQKFKTIENANKALNTNLESFAKIIPPTTLEARNENQWGLWNEWRQHNDNIMANGYALYQKWVQEVDPKGAISVSGTQIATPFDGFDWSKLSPYFETMQGYGYGDQERKRMSFAKTSMINATPAGYGRSGSAVDFQLWSSVVNHGGGHVLFWWVAFRNPDLSFCQSAYDYMKAFKPFLEGLGRQYLLTRREQSPIAILYSMNSMRGGYSTAQDYHDANDHISKALVSLGYDPTYISDAQVAKGDLIKRKLKILFMVNTHSLGLGKIGDLNVKKSIENFIKQGGCVYQLGESTLDEFLQPLSLEDGKIKGVKTISEIDIEVKKAIADLYPPRVKIFKENGTIFDPMSYTCHQIGNRKDAKIITLLRPPVGSKEVLGADGVMLTVKNEADGDVNENIQVDLSKLNYKIIYNIRSGKKVTLTEGRFSLNMMAGDGIPLALLPYEVLDVQLSGERTDDGYLKLSWHIQTDQIELAPHVVRISIISNGSIEDVELSQNATTEINGKGAIDIPLSIEDIDSNQQFQITIKDILSGKISTSISL